MVKYPEIESLFKESIDEVIKRESTAFDKAAQRCKESIVLFGAGGLGLKTLTALRREGIEPLAFSDNNRSIWGSSIDGIKIFSPQEAAIRFGSTAIFVVTIWHPGKGHRMTNVLSQLMELGCKNVIPFPILHWKYSAYFLPNFCLDLPHKLIPEKKEIIDAYSLWSDDFSRKEYVAQLKWRFNSDWSQLSDPVEEEQYFVSDIFRMRKECFVDCGAFDGDTLKLYLNRHCDSLKKYVAFEPDPVNYKDLMKYVLSLDKDTRGKIKIYPFAVGNVRKRVYFDATGTTGACVSEIGEFEVESVTLDEMLLEEKPTYIKMDIEGEEMKALEGAREVIAKHRTVLAICVYHNQNDLWKVPLKIKSICDGYNFYLRPNGDDCWDTVCYAVPVERVST